MRPRDGRSCPRTQEAQGRPGSPWDPFRPGRWDKDGVVSAAPVGHPDSGETEPGEEMGDREVTDLGPPEPWAELPERQAVLLRGRDAASEQVSAPPIYNSQRAKCQGIQRGHRGDEAAGWRGTGVFWFLLLRCWGVRAAGVWRLPVRLPELQFRLPPAEGS